LVVGLTCLPLPGLDGDLNPGMGDEVRERRLFATYEKYGEFSNAQQCFLDIDLQSEPTPSQSRTEGGLLRQLSNIVRPREIFFT